jgi:hypothetical protein
VANSNCQNVVWVFGDQHRAQAPGCAGDPNVGTPHIDALASDGVSFANAVAGCPWCTPFRGSLLTSLYPHLNVQRTPQLIMFHLNKDPYELANLAFLDVYNDKRAERQVMLADWPDKTGDEFELPEL